MPPHAPATDQPRLEHLDGCPTRDRTESYPDTVPATADRPARPVTVTRCVQCGAHRVEPRKE